MELSIILPSYLEQKNLEVILPKLKTSLDELNLKYEILVIDTVEKMDDTPAVCQQNQVRYINREGGNSYGDAIRTGISKAQGKKVIFMDADGSHDPAFIKQMWENTNQDLVIASRYIEGGTSDNSPILILMSKIVNFGYAFVLNIKCKDVSNSFKMYEGQHLKELTLRCENFDVVEEILFKIVVRP